MKNAPVKQQKLWIAPLIHDEKNMPHVFSELSKNLFNNNKDNTYFV